MNPKEHNARTTRQRTVNAQRANTQQTRPMLVLSVVLRFVGLSVEGSLSVLTSLVVIAAYTTVLRSGIEPTF